MFFSSAVSLSFIATQALIVSCSPLSTSSHDRRVELSSSATTDTNSTANSNYTLLPLNADSEFSFELVRDLSNAVSGGGDIGEILIAANNIKASNFESWYDAFITLADRTLATAQSINAKKYPVSARDAYFKASTYYRSADFYTHANQSDPRINDVWAKQQAAFDAAIALLDVPAKRINITAKGFYVPAIWYPASTTSSKKPTIIIGGGYDGGQEELYHQMGVAALARGYNVLTYEGPGQASVVRYQNLGFIPEWENVVTPVVDWLYTQKQVDKKRIALLGLSFGGYLAPRASAFEPRLAATVALDGLIQMGTLILAQFPAALTNIFNAGNQTTFDVVVNKIRADPTYPTEFRWLVDQGTWAFRTSSPFNWLTQLLKFDLTPVLSEIPGPILVADAASDLFFQDSGKKLADALGSRATYHKFDLASGVGHAGVGGFVQQAQVVYDWLQDVFESK